MTRIDELINECAIAWYTLEELRRHDGNDEYDNYLLGRAYALRQALEIMTGKQWRYNRRNEAMELDDYRGVGSR